MEINKNEIIEEEKHHLVRPKLLKPFVFPPLKESIKQEIDLKTRTHSQTFEEEPEMVSLLRKPKKQLNYESNGNSSTISDGGLEIFCTGMRNFENCCSLREIKNIEENPFEEFEDEDRKHGGGSRTQIENFQKFVLMNMHFTGVAECPLKIENIEKSFMHEEKQRITLCQVPFKNNFF